MHEAIEAGNRNKLTDGRLLIILFHSLSFYKKNTYILNNVAFMKISIK